MKRSTHTIAAHLIHSRLELIRHRFWPRWCLPELFRKMYADILLKAAKSVSADHKITCEEKDIQGAIALLLESLQGDFAVKYYVIMQPDYENRTAHAVITRDGGHTLSPAHPSDRLTYHEALAIKRDIESIHKNDQHLYLDTRYHIPPNPEETAP